MAFFGLSVERLTFGAETFLRQAASRALNAKRLTVSACIIARASATPPARQSPPPSPKPAVATEQELSDFLKSVEKRAYKRAFYHVQDEDAAPDIVQASMMKLAEHYGDKPDAELPPLFQRILSPTTLDWFRRDKTRRSHFSTMSELAPDDTQSDADLLEALAGAEWTQAESAENAAGRAEILRQIEDQLAQLPDRQREAFLLRYWEEMDVAETAAVMGCAQGSVKTHCSRAIRTLAKALKSKGSMP
jgi:RNA polymerase sigma-70 factor (ECF subfamily)